MNIRPDPFNRKRKSLRAMTLVETMVAVGIGSLALAVVGVLSLYSSRSFASMANYAELDSASHRTLDQMIREIRQTTALTAFQTNQLTFKDFDGTRLVYSYDPTAKTLSRIRAGVTNDFRTDGLPLLTNCVALQFGIYQRNPQGAGKFVATADPTTCKLVDVTWKCVRTNYMSTRLNTESVQTAKIVIRNKR